MPRKAKPLRMWMVKFPDGSLCYMRPTHTRKQAKSELSCALYPWGCLHRDGYRAVRVTVTEDTNGR